MPLVALMYPLLASAAKSSRDRFLESKALTLALAWIKAFTVLYAQIALHYAVAFCLVAALDICAVAKQKFDDWFRTLRCGRVQQCISVFRYNVGGST
jgi:hypothetical protein